MEIHFANKGIDNYVEVNLFGKLASMEDGYNQLRMLQECDIEGMIKPINYTVDENEFLGYMISGMYILERFWQRKRPNGSFLKNMLLEISNMIGNMDKYMLNQNNLVLDLRYIFYDESKEKIRCLYIPGYDKDIRIQMKQLLEKMMIVFDHNDRNGVEQLYSIYHQVVEENFSFVQGVKLVTTKSKSIKRVGDNQVDLENDINVNKKLEIGCGQGLTNIGVGIGVNDFCEAGIGNKEVQSEKNSLRDIVKFFAFGVNIVALLGLFFKYFMLGGKKVDIYIIIALIVTLLVQIIVLSSEDKEDEDKAMQEYEVLNKEKWERKTQVYEGLVDNVINVGCIGNVNDVDDINGAGDKFIEIASKEDVKSLMPLTNGILEKIELSNPFNEITIGRSNSNADYRLMTNQISRMHATIIKENGMTYIIDNKSTNGTYINSKRLLENQKALVCVGDIVRFANEDFVAL